MCISPFGLRICWLGPIRSAIRRFPTVHIGLSFKKDFPEERVLIPFFYYEYLEI